ncbi:MAG: hypothetical protein IT304_01505 [Dehalococcoidia bacterium]|nr:hypothetical protein [Dehalococcoidia bacterium]
MTARQPRRARRRVVPASTLPRPVAGAALEHPAEPVASPGTTARTPRRSASRGREHHVTTDYRYVHTDLYTIGGVGLIVIAFIVAMSFVVG